MTIFAARRGAATPCAEALDAALGMREIVIGDLILVELLQGYRQENEAREVQSALAALSLIALCGPDLAVAAADNYRFLRTRGITIRGTIDVVIATWCIASCSLPPIATSTA